MLAAAAVLGFASCEEYPDAFELADGVPTVHYVRYADRDVLIEQAFMGEVVCFVGENLCSVHQLYFNDQKTVLNTSFITENTLVAAVPGNLPAVKTDKVYMITKNKDTVSVDFRVMMPAPQLKSMSCEFQQPGTDVTIYGNYFAEPMTITFEDGAGPAVTSFKSLSMTEVTFTIPADAKPGKVKVETESGLARSPFSYYDFCDGLITDFDGTTDIVPQGWNFSGEYKSEGGILDTHDGSHALSALIAAGSTGTDGSFAVQDSLSVSAAAGIAAAAAVCAGQAGIQLIQTGVGLNVEDLGSSSQDQTEGQTQTAQQSNRNYNFHTSLALLKKCSDRRSP